MFSEFESGKICMIFNDSWRPCYTHQLMRDLKTLAFEPRGVQSRTIKQGWSAEGWLKFDTKVVSIQFYFDTFDELVHILIILISFDFNEQEHE